MGMNGISLTVAVGTLRCNFHIPLTPRLHDLPQCGGSQSLTDTWLSPSKVPVTIRGWRIIEEAQMLLRKVGLRKVMLKKKKKEKSC